MPIAFKRCGKPCTGEFLSRILAEHGHLMQGNPRPILVEDADTGAVLLIPGENRNGLNGKGYSTDGVFAICIVGGSSGITAGGLTFRKLNCRASYRFVSDNIEITAC